MAQGVEIRISANTKDAESSVRKLEQDVKRLSDVKSKGTKNDGVLSRKDMDEFKSAMDDFRHVYDSYVSSLKNNLSDLKNQISEFDKELARASQTSDDKSKASCEAQLNYLKAQQEMIQRSISSAEEMRKTQQRYSTDVDGMSVGTPPSSGGSGGGGGQSPPSDPDNPDKGNNDASKTLLNASTAFFAVRKAHGYMMGGYHSMETDEMGAYRLAQKTGEYGSDYTSARKDLENTGSVNGYNAKETTQSALLYAHTGGVNNVQKNMEDVQSMQKFSRAYATDANQLASVSGDLNKMGATTEGNQRKFAQMLAESIKDQGMHGRESELIQATNSLAQNLSNNKLSVSGGELNNLMSFQNAIASLSPQLKGQQGANAIASFDDRIHNASNNQEILMGRGTEFSGPSGMWALRKQKEKGVSDPDNVARIFKNAKRFGNFKDDKQAASHVKMIISEATGWKTDMVDKIIDDPKLYDKFASGKFGQDELESLTHGSGDLDKKSEDFNDSDVSRREHYKTNYDNTRKRAGGMMDTLATPFQSIYNHSPWPVRMAMSGAIGLGGVALTRKGLKYGLKGAKKLFKDKPEPPPPDGETGAEGNKTAKGSESAKGTKATKAGAKGATKSGAKKAVRKSILESTKKVAGKGAGYLGKGLEFVGSHAPVIGGAIEGISQFVESKANDENTGKAIAKGAGGAVGGGLGAWGGAEAGAAVGSMFAPGLGTAIGGGIGLIGGWLGGKLGGKAAGSVYDAVNKPPKLDPSPIGVSNDIASEKLKKSTEKTPSKVSNTDIKSIEKTTKEIYDILRDTKHSSKSDNHTSVSKDTSKLPKYAKGSPYITYDQVAVVHEGESITKASDNPNNPANLSKNMVTNLSSKSEKVESKENPNDPNSTTNQRGKQQSKQDNLLDKEEHIIRKREEILRDSNEHLEKMDKNSGSRVSDDSSFWNNSTQRVDDSGQGDDSSEHKGLLGSMWDWVKDKASGLFGGGSSEDSGGSGAGDAGAYKNAPKLGGSTGAMAQRSTKAKSGSMPTAKQIDDWIASKAPKDSPMRGTGADWIAASKASGLDVGYLVSHAAQETGWGGHGGTNSILNKKHNWFGIGAFNSSPGSSAHGFKNNREGITAGAQWIAKNYANKGQDSLYKMLYGKKNHAYATYDDEKTPNKEWMTSIANIWSGAPKYAIGTNSVPKDQLAVVHKGEAIVPAMDNPYNKQNPFALLEKARTESSGGSEKATTGNYTINVNVSGSIQGMNAKNQAKVSASIANAFGAHSNNLMSLLQNDSVREAR